jgi:hypothetical protein
MVHLLSEILSGLFFLILYPFVSIDALHSLVPDSPMIRLYCDMNEPKREREREKESRAVLYVCNCGNIC